MTRDDIMRMARETDCLDDQHYGSVWADKLECFANLVAAAEREKLAQWMIQRSYATGHGDTTEDLLQELDWQIAENWNRALINGVETEREACAKVCEARNSAYCAFSIRERGAP